MNKRTETILILIINDIIVDRIMKIHKTSHPNLIKFYKDKFGKQKYCFRDEFLYYV